MFRYTLVIFLVFSFAYTKDDMASLKKEKLEIQTLKKDLNTFYNKKEKEYKEKKKKLDSLFQQIQKEKQEIKELNDNNQKLLNNIKQIVVDKTAKIFNGMKAKIAAQIFDKMIDEGKIEDVFDIILKLKEKKITVIMRYLNITNASILTQMLKNYAPDEKNKE